jgi:hypothetical protein
VGKGSGLPAARPPGARVKRILCGGHGIAGAGERVVAGVAACARLQRGALILHRRDPGGGRQQLFRKDLYEGAHRHRDLLPVGPADSYQRNLLSHAGSITEGSQTVN